MVSSNKQKSIIARIMMFASAVIWGSTFVVLKDAISTLPIFFVLMLRFIGGGIFLGVVCLVTRRKFTKSSIWKGSVTGVVLAIAYATQTIGLNNTTPGKNAFLTAVYCVLVPFMMWALRRGRPTIYNIIATCLGLAGIGLISFTGEGIGSFSFLGDGMTLIGGIFYAVQIVLMAIFLKGEDSMTFTFWEIVSCGLCMLVLWLSTELDQPIVISGSAWWKLIYLAVLGTGFTLMSMTIGAKYMPASGVALLMSLEAVFGVIFSIIFYKEEVTVRTGIGFGLVFMAVIINEYVSAKIAENKEKKAKKQKEEAQLTTKDETNNNPNG